MKRLKELLDQVESPTILDIGTGSGQFVNLVSSVCGHFECILGVDTSDRAIEAARKHNSDERIVFENKDVMSMTQTFDVVCLSNSLHHFEDPKAIVDKMIELTHPGGKIIIQEMYRDHQTDKQMTHVHLHHFWAEVDRLTGNVHNNTFTKKEVLDQLADSRLKLIDAWDVEFEEKHVFTEEDYGFLKSSIHNSLKRAEDLDDYNQLREKGRILEKRIEEVGFDLATELMIVLNKS